jgi:hypothetical protein
MPFKKKNQLYITWNTITTLTTPQNTSHHNLGEGSGVSHCELRSVLLSPVFNSVARN